MKAWRSVCGLTSLVMPARRRDASDYPAGAGAVEALAVEAEEDRALTALAHCEVDGACRPWRERDGDDLVAPCARW